MKTCYQRVFNCLAAAVLGAAPGCFTDYGSDCNRSVDLECFWEKHPGTGTPSPGACGDGALDDGEACDDGNTADCDGCRGDCSAVETGCGDGVRCDQEECDDGNDLPGDGCFECQSECKPGSLLAAGAPETNVQVFTPPDALRCYARVANPRKTWDPARKACQDWGGDLVAFGTIEEQAEVFEALPGTSNAWTGGTGAAGTYQWSSGEPWPQEAAWGEGQPDSDAPACVELTTAGPLDDVDCSTLNPYICERTFAPQSP